MVGEPLCNFFWQYGWIVLCKHISKVLCLVGWPYFYIQDLQVGVCGVPMFQGLKIPIYDIERGLPYTTTNLANLFDNNHILRIYKQTNIKSRHKLFQ
jgi:hypothetical protein